MAQYLLQRTLVTRRLLVEVSIVYFISFPSLLLSLSFFFFFKLIFLVIGITTMRENKEKTVTSEDEDVAAPPLV